MLLHLFLFKFPQSTSAASSTETGHNKITRIGKKALNDNCLFLNDIHNEQLSGLTM